MAVQGADSTQGNRRVRVIIMGAAGRDFHNFNVFFRDNPGYEVVAFTAAQIPDIAGRVYPPELTGSGYPEGIPIFPEEELGEVARQRGAQVAVFSYSDVPYTYVMHKSAECMSMGLDFWLLGPGTTMLESPKPVVAVTAVRTGVGKSQTTRALVSLLQQRGHRVVVVRHPMPYGDLPAQAVQRFATYEDLDRHHTTIEEREEYEPHIRRGVVVYAGVDYAAILAEAVREADIILWDGGNNDLPFFRPDMHVVLVDPHRPGHERAYYPGEANLRLAHVVIINKVDTARPDGVEAVRETSRRLNPRATILEAASPIFVEDPSIVRGRRVLVIEDGPTLTHGGMTYGAGVIAAKKFGAAELIDPRPYAVGSIAGTFQKYPKVGTLLPAMGYGSEQIADLAATIDKTPADLVVIGTPIDLRKVIDIKKPSVRVSYELEVIGRPNLEDAVEEYLSGIAPGIARRAEPPEAPAGGPRQRQSPHVPPPAERGPDAHLG